MPDISPLAPKTFPELPPLKGVQLASAMAGIRYKNRKDVMFAVLPEGTQAAGVYTRSLTAAAPIEWCRSASTKARALVVNAGNANAFTGKAGEEAVQKTAAAVAKLIKCKEQEVCIASTGVIGEKLPVEKIIGALPEMLKNLSEKNWRDAAEAIMTTDTFPKLATRQAKLGDKTVTINGFAKGSGMIAPDMATMLAYIFTDAAIDAPILKTLLGRANHRTFNCTTVDGDTSTSDMVVLFATGTAGNKKPEDAADHALLGDFKRQLTDLMEDLAKQVVRDGEGATKLVTIDVSGAEEDEAARRIGMSIGNSPLVKTAIAAADPNWGRIVAAIGKAGEWADRDKLVIRIGNVLVAENGDVSPAYDEALAKEHLQRPEILISVDVGVGSGHCRVWTCDLTENYIKINANYRS